MLKFILFFSIRSQHIESETNSLSSLHIIDPTHGSNPNVPVKPRRKVRSTRIESVYIPTKKFARYRSALSSFIPIRSTNTDNTGDIPIDNVGCLSNVTFLWVRQFLIPRNEQPQYTNLPLNTNQVHLLPKGTYRDGCEINSKRLLGIYKDEITTKGEQAVSLLRVVWKFCSTRILVASVFHILTTLFGLLGLYSLKNVIEPMTEIPPNESYSFDWSAFGHLTAFLICFILVILLKNIVNWINLRTAIRLRTGILTACYKKAMKSCMVHNISAHQMMNFFNEEGDSIFNLVENGTNIIGIVISVILCLVFAVILLGLPGILPFIPIIGVMILIVSTNMFNCRPTGPETANDIYEDSRSFFFTFFLGLVLSRV